MDLHEVARGEATTSKRALKLIVLAGAAALLLGWLVMRARQPAAAPPAAEDDRVVEPAAPPPQPSTSRWPPRPPPATTTSEQAAPEDSRPHPLTPEHERLFAHRRLGHAIDDATDARDTAAMRALLDQYEAAYPEDELGIAAAYRLILACFEHPGADARAAAERWLDKNNGSVVKRSIVRYCIEEGGQ